METKKSQQRFTEEFKTEAVRQVTERGHPVADPTGSSSAEADGGKGAVERRKSIRLQT